MFLWINSRENSIFWYSTCNDFNRKYGFLGVSSFISVPVRRPVFFRNHVSQTERRNVLKSLKCTIYDSIPVKKRYFGTVPVTVSSENTVFSRFQCLFGFRFESPVFLIEIYNINIEIVTKYICLLLKDSFAICFWIQHF